MTLVWSVKNKTARWEFKKMQTKKMYIWTSFSEEYLLYLTGDFT